MLLFVRILSIWSNSSTIEIDLKKKRPLNLRCSKVGLISVMAGHSDSSHITIISLFFALDSASRLCVGFILRQALLFLHGQECVLFAMAPLKVPGLSFIVLFCVTCSSLTQVWPREMLWLTSHSLVTTPPNLSLSEKEVVSHRKIGLLLPEKRS